MVDGVVTEAEVSIGVLCVGVVDDGLADEELNSGYCGRREWGLIVEWGFVSISVVEDGS